MPGLTQIKPLRKMGLHSSPTGELFLQDVRVARDRLLGETEESAVPDGRQGDLLDRAHRRGLDGARHRRALPRALARVRARARAVRAPIGEFQLIQDKLAHMEVAR